MRGKAFIIAVFFLCTMTLVSGQEINISQLSLDEKLGQMVMVSGNQFNEAYLALHIGGIFIDAKMSKEEYQELIARYQNASPISLFVATDLEGYWNPFTFAPSKAFGEIGNDVEAYEVGSAQGEVLREMGFTMDFSPVVETRNEVWPGRSFIGSHEEVRTKILQYIAGLQSKGIIATAKHYPGGSMLRDPHKYRVHATITADDLSYFNDSIAHHVGAVMVGHPIVTGVLDSHGKQASVSPEVISHLRASFPGIIVTDSIGMLGIRLSYLFNGGKLYVDLVRAGNDIILDTGKLFSSPRGVGRGIGALKQAIQRGEISQQQIDMSLQRILSAKGYKVVT